MLLPTDTQLLIPTDLRSPQLGRHYLLLNLAYLRSSPEVGGGAEQQTLEVGGRQVAAAEWWAPEVGGRG